MRNLHDLKSFHENALNEWSATAIIMKEALKDEPDTRKTFVEVVLALSDMAGKDAKKRQNLLKAGHVVLHGLADGKSAKALVTISYNNRTETATIRLRKFESQWYLEQFDI